MPLAIERAINLNREIGEVRGWGFTKLGGICNNIHKRFKPSRGEPSYRDNYLFIDVMDSTGFIEEHGRDTLVEIMNDIKVYMERSATGR